MKIRLTPLTFPQQLLIIGFVALIAVLMATWNLGTPWQSVSGIAFSPDGRRIAIDLFSGRFRRTYGRWYLTDVSHAVALGSPLDEAPPAILGRCQRSGNLNMLPETCLGQSVAFSSDGSLLASAGSDGQFELWDCVTRRLKTERATDRDHLRSVVAVPGQR